MEEDRSQKPGARSQEPGARSQEEESVPYSGSWLLAPGSFLEWIVRHFGAVGVLAGLVLWGLWLHTHEGYGPVASFTLLAGVLFGFVLQRSRFCFFCIYRDFLEKRDSRPMMGIMAALAVGSLGYAVVLGARIPDPQAGWLPAEAFIGPVGWHLVVGGAVFGLGMAFSGSCISAHMYRLGEGSLLAPVALAGSVGGFVLAFQVWDWFYLRAVSGMPVVWLPEYAGYGVAVVVHLFVLGLLAMGLMRWRGNQERSATLFAVDDMGGASLRQVWGAVFVQRWPAWVGGVGIGLLSAFLYMRTSMPMGVTAELSRLSRGLAGVAGIMPDRLEGLDQLRGCIPPQTEQWLSGNGIFVLSLVCGALVAGLLAGQFRPRRQPLPAVAMALGGGVMLGFGAMIALGCTIGTLLSGIHAFAGSGWTFLAASFAGTWMGLRVKRLVVR